MENKIKKLLIGFFLFMLLCTFISRAVDSAMVAKVQVDQVRRRILTYEVSGTGVVQAKSQIGIDFITGYRIGKVSVKKGQQVEKGELLYQYDMASLKDKKSEVENVLSKLLLQYKEVGLVREAEPGTMNEKAALLAMETAQEDMERAIQAITDKRIAVKENKIKYYEEAISNLYEVTASCKVAEQVANRAVEDAQKELLKLKESTIKLEEILQNYTIAVKMQNIATIEKEYKQLFEFYYDGKYQEHQEQIEKVEKKLTRAMEDMEKIQFKWGNLELPEYYYDQGTKNTYYEMLVQMKVEIDNAKRAVEDAQEEYDDLTEADHNITNTILAYKGCIEINSKESDTYLDLSRKLLLKGKSVNPSELENAELKLERALEDQENTSEAWDKKKNAAIDKVNQLEQDLKAIEGGSYDYTKDLAEEKKILKSAERSLDLARLQLEQVRNSQEFLKEQDKKQSELNSIHKGILEIDIRQNQQILEKIEKLIENSGEVLAPVSGIITDHNLTQGITITGQEKMDITTGGYVLYMTAEKDEMQNFVGGDEVLISTGVDHSETSSEIVGIEQSKENGKICFTANLPDGEYPIGASMDFRLNKESKEYARCIPIQALRQDRNGIYLLVVREEDSVLGEVQEAFRVNVTVLSKDNKVAAVEAQLSEEDRIITDSNRNLSEGDRVRVYEVE